jgi:small nuclear ribonucleoprotein (snRNP)-like protein
MRWSFWQPYPQLRRVIVNLKSGTVFRGLIWQRKGPFLVLREVEMLSDRDSKMEPRGTNGEILVQLVDVDFIQVPN